MAHLYKLSLYLKNMILYSIHYHASFVKHLLLYVYYFMQDYKKLLGKKITSAGRCGCQPTHSGEKLYRRKSSYNVKKLLTFPDGPEQ